MTDARTVWEGFFEQAENRWREPHEAVESLVPRLREHGCRDVLDLGCGAGRHLVHLAEQGFRPYGLDLSRTALGHARAWLLDQGRPVRLVRSDMGALPFRTASFDALLSLFVIYHGTRAEVARRFEDVHRIVRPGGLVLVNLIGRDHDRYGRGQQLEPHTFAPDIGPDRGVPHRFSDRGEAEALLADFQLLKLDELSSTQAGERHQHWQVLAKRMAD
ncbi:MAG: class I SAM-dependent methyltransferase [Candidatus Bipolaricaulia bacterium]